MRRHLPELHLARSSDQRPGELIKGVTEALVDRNGQTLPGTAEVAPHQPCIAVPARAGELQRLLGASFDENAQLTAHVAGSRRSRAGARHSLPSCAGSCVEFGLLLPEASPHYTAAIAKRLCELLASRPLVVRGFPEVSERITLSSGVARGHAGESSAEWYARADAALYEAKRQGRNGISIARMLELQF